MDKLGERLIRDRDQVSALRSLAADLEGTARRLRTEADEIERLAELARFELPPKASMTERFGLGRDENIA